MNFYEQKLKEKKSKESFHGSKNAKEKNIDRGSASILKKEKPSKDFKRRQAM